MTGDGLRQWLRRIGQLVRSRRFDAELQSEIEFHVDMRARSLESEGWTPAEARREARRQVGRPLQVREETRDVWAFRRLDELTQDLRYALRGLRRNPGFSIAVVATLALGIGANSAMFSVVDSLLLRPAPFADPSRLVLVQAARPTQHEPELLLSYPNFLDLRARAKTFSAISIWTIGETTVGGTSEPEQVQYALTSANLFDLLGVRVIRGRAFRADEEKRGTPPVAIISHRLWSQRFSADPAVMGRPIILDGKPHEIVGVLPPEFHFVSYPHDTDVWLPFGLDTFTDRVYARGLSTLWAIARLRPDTTLDQATTEVAAIAGALEREFPEFNRHRLMQVVPLEARATKNVRWPLIALSAGVVLVLLIACANVVSLLLARASARQHELAVRRVLGGSRRRLARQLLTEYLVLSLAGGVAGIGVAWMAGGLLSKLPYNMPDLFTPWVASLDQFGLNSRVLLFTLGVSLVAGLVVGVLPAMHGAAAPAASIATGARATGTRRTMRLRGAFVVAEIAMAVVLLAAMSLMLATVATLRSVDPGFRPQGITTVDVNLSAARYPANPAITSFYARLMEALRSQPGVTGAASVEYLPFGGLDSDTGLLYADRPIPPPDKRPRVHPRAVTDDYFTIMGIAPVAGRAFAASDRADSTRVVILNETAAHQLFPDGHALGQKISIDYEAMRFYQNRAPDFDLSIGLREVVGIVRDVRHTGLADRPFPEFYMPFSQHPVRRMTVVVKSDADPAATFALIRSSVAAIDPAQPIARLSTLSGLITASLDRPRFNMTLISAFGVLALALAAVGIYGVMSYFVTLRTRDIGIHVAIGATRADVFRLVARQMMWLAAWGIGLGIAGAVLAASGVSRLLSLYGIAPRDPRLLAAVALIAAITAAAATIIPAVRALNIDPARALRAPD